MSLNATNILPMEVWQYIVELDGTTALGSTCKSFKSITDRVISNVWKEFLAGKEKKSYPIISTFLSKVGSAENLVSMKTLHSLFLHLNEKLARTNSNIPYPVPDSFPLHPAYYQSIEKEIPLSSELRSTWERLKAVLPKRCKGKAPSDQASKSEIVEWIKNNNHAFTYIKSLDFSCLGLTKLPVEISSIPMPCLQSVNLSHNRLTAIPNGFGKRWKNVEHLDLINNEISEIPPGFFDNYPNLKKLTLAKNPIANSWDATASSPGVKVVCFLPFTFSEI
ncbi:MAG: leucine-rich repeat domain-containing protein [Chlamydiales bacterium]|nr:leucine-rich repeat domain-containing protein [Chlamydiales bacterium]